MAQKLFSQPNPSPIWRAANFDDPNGGEPGVKLRHSDPCHPFRLHAGSLSSRDAKCQRHAEILRERFSMFSQKSFLTSKSPVFPCDVARTRSSVITQIGSAIFQDNGISKNGHRPFRKFLWLIPFMLAKKLLSKARPFAKNNFASIVCAAKTCTRCA